MANPNRYQQRGQEREPQRTALPPTPPAPLPFQPQPQAQPKRGGLVVWEVVGPGSVLSGNRLFGPGDLLEMSEADAASLPPGTLKAG